MNALEGLNKGNPAAMAVYVAAGRNGSPKVTINGGNFTNSVTTESDHYDLIYVDEGTVEINDGTFKCVTPKWTLNCKDGSASASISSILRPITPAKLCSAKAAPSPRTATGTSFPGDKSISRF